MVIKGKIRSDGAQLAEYLITLADNSHIEILEVDGREGATKDYLQQIIMSMDFNSEMTKTDMAFYHLQLNPAPGEDQLMTREKWYQAADILANETGFENQRRVIVLHTKKDRIHAHVVYERYDHLTGKMKDNKHSRLKQDQARMKMEGVLQQKPTPRRNPQRAELKEAATKLWNETGTGAEFIIAAYKFGYMIAEGTANRPFMIVDENGRTFDLVRQLKGVRTKEVRARLRHEKLVPEKQAIDLMRQKKDTGSNAGQQDTIDNQQKARNVAASFADNHKEVITPDNTTTGKEKRAERAEAFASSKQDIETADEPKVDEKRRKQHIAGQFADNRQLIPDDRAAQELKRQELIAEQQRIRQNKQKIKPRQ